MPIELPRYRNGQAVLPMYAYQWVRPWDRNGLRPLRADCPHPRYIPEGTRYCEQLHAFVPADLPFYTNRLHKQEAPVCDEEKSLFERVFAKKEEHVCEDVKTWRVKGLTHHTFSFVTLEQAQANERIKYRDTGVLTSEEKKDLELWELWQVELPKETFDV